MSHLVKSKSFLTKNFDQSEHAEYWVLTGKFWGPGLKWLTDSKFTGVAPRFVPRGKGLTDGKFTGAPPRFVPRGKGLTDRKFTGAPPKFVPRGKGLTDGFADICCTPGTKGLTIWKTGWPTPDMNWGFTGCAPIKASCETNGSTGCEEPWVYGTHG